MIPDEPLIVRSPRRKRSVSLHVEADGSLRVLAPPHTSLRWIKKFIQEKKNWIERRRQNLGQEKRPLPAPLTHGSTVPFLGESLTLALTPISNDHPAKTVFLPDQKTLCIHLPANLPPAHLEAEIHTELILWYKKQARTYLHARMESWTKETGLRPTKLLFSNARRQWGSCSTDNIIRLNWRLVCAAPALIDYIIVHELCHIPHKNHGKAFWAHCATLMPDFKKHRQSLRNWEKSYNPSVFLQPH